MEELDGLGTLGISGGDNIFSDISSGLYWRSFNRSITCARVLSERYERFLNFFQKTWTSIPGSLEMRLSCGGNNVKGTLNFIRSSKGEISEKARRILGYEEKYRLATSLAEIISGYIKNVTVIVWI